MKASDLRTVIRLADAIEAFTEAMKTANAQEVRAELRTDIRKVGEKIINDAQHEAKRIIDQAREEADKIVLDKKTIARFAEFDNDLSVVKRRLDEITTNTEKAEREHAMTAERIQGEIRDFNMLIREAEDRKNAAEREARGAEEALKNRIDAAETAHTTHMNKLKYETEQAEKKLAEAQRKHANFLEEVGTAAWRR